MASEPDADTPEIRLNKAIADSGYCARRKADELIVAGRVQINGQLVTTPGVKVLQTDIVSIDGLPLPQKTGARYLLFHKPVNCITSRKAQARVKTIYDFLPKDFHTLDPAGRLDKDSSGALILSDDGDFLHRLMHPRYHLPKIYRLSLDRPLDPADARRLEQGVRLLPENKEARMANVKPDPNDASRCEVTLFTGYNRQIRRSLAILRYRVRKLHRTAIGSIELGNLPPGQSRPLSLSEKESIFAQGACAPPDN